MRIYPGADRSTFQALMTVGSGTRLFDTPANATDFLRKAAEWWNIKDEVHWLVPEGEVPEATLARLQVMRNSVQALANGNREAYQDGLHRLASIYEFKLHFPNGGLEAVATGWEGFVASLVLPLAELDEIADRLRHCANDDCYWMFVDLSRSGTRTWCSTTVCGNRIRLKRFQERKANPRGQSRSS